MSVIANIFKKKEKLIKFDFSILKTDMHSHLIPNIDDGSKSIEDSLFLIKGLINLGYKNIITTPHIMSDFYKNTPEIINNGLYKLQKAIDDNNIDIKINAAAEYYIDFEFTQKIDNEQLLTFGNNYVLIECSFVNPPQNINEVIFKLQTSGYKPILAHPERYIYWLKDLKQYEYLKDRDVLFQVNILSLIGMYSADSKHIAEYLIKNEMVDFLATDLHNDRHLKLLSNMHVKESIANKIKKHTWLNASIETNKLHTNSKVSF